MVAEKFSISLDEELGRALRSAAAAEGVNVSAWLAGAVRQRLRHDALGLALDDVLAQEGWTREELLREVPVLRARRKSA